MLVPNRNYSSPSYRYGFNGKEKDDEVKGLGTQYDYGFRIYDPRLGKFLSEDPLKKDFPFLTPYQFASNTPISAIDLDGLENYIAVQSPWFTKEIKSAIDANDMERVVQLSFLATYAPANDEWALNSFNGNEMAASYNTSAIMPDGLTVWGYNDKGAPEMLFGFQEVQKKDISENESTGFCIGMCNWFKKGSRSPTRVIYSNQSGYMFWGGPSLGSDGTRIIGGKGTKSINADFLDYLAPFGSRKVPVTSLPTVQKIINNLTKGKDIANRISDIGTGTKRIMQSLEEAGKLTKKERKKITIKIRDVTSEITEERISPTTTIRSLEEKDTVIYEDDKSKVLDHVNKGSNKAFDKYSEEHDKY